MTDIENLLFLDLETRSSRRSQEDRRIRHMRGAFHLRLPSPAWPLAWKIRGSGDRGRTSSRNTSKHLEVPHETGRRPQRPVRTAADRGRPASTPRLATEVAIDRCWICTMARARAQALPASLDGAGMALGPPLKKDGDGWRLMLTRSCRPRRTSDGSLAWWEDEDRMTRLS